MTCKYCNLRDVTMTLCTDEGVYACCSPCAAAWDLKAKAFAAMAEVRMLEWMWSLPEVEERRDARTI